MLKFWSHQYSLQPLTQIGALAESELRVGALLKVQWPNGKIGYADLFPWTELGDADLAAQLHALSQGRISHLVEQSIWLAKRDADLRAQSRNAFQGLERVKNHFLINDPTRVEDATLMEMKSAGFTTVKIKIGRQLEQEAAFIDRVFKQHQQFLVRLDCNASVSFERFEKFISGFPVQQRARIEFVEDPCPYHEAKWSRLSELVPIAVDQEYDKVQWDRTQGVPFKVVVIKPARQDVPKAVDQAQLFDLKMVITSSLDHPVGVAHAAWVAGELKEKHPNTVLDSGCLSLRSYRGSDFSLAIGAQGPYITGVRGRGVGFDTFFEKIAWNPIQMFK